MRVHRYPLSIRVNGSPTRLDLPAGAEVLQAGLINDTRGLNRLNVWALVNPDPEWPQAAQMFVVCATGEDLPAGNVWRHVGTVFLQSDPVEVYHVFVGRGTGLQESKA